MSVGTKQIWKCARGEGGPNKSSFRVHKVDIYKIIYRDFPSLKNISFVMVCVIC